MFGLVQNELTLIFAHSVINRLKLIIFTVYLGCISVITYTRSFEFSRLSHYLIIKVHSTLLPLSNSASIFYHTISLLSRTFLIFFMKQNQRRNRDLNPGAATNDLLPFQGSPFSLLGISPRLTRKPYKTEKVGFEPTVPFRITGFQDRLFKPLRHLSSDCLQLQQLNQFNMKAKHCQATF